LDDDVDGGIGVEATDVEEFAEDEEEDVNTVLFGSDDPSVVRISILLSAGAESIIN
jgi:hypothetical protein